MRQNQRKVKLMKEKFKRKERKKRKKEKKYIVGSQGIVQLGGSGPWYNQGGSAKVGACEYFLLTERSLVIN